MSHIQESNYETYRLLPIAAKYLRHGSSIFTDTDGKVYLTFPGGRRQLSLVSENSGKVLTSPMSMFGELVNWEAARYELHHYISTGSWNYYLMQEPKSYGNYLCFDANTGGVFSNTYYGAWQFPCTHYYETDSKH